MKRFLPLLLLALMAPALAQITWTATPLKFKLSGANIPTPTFYATEEACVAAAETNIAGVYYCTNSGISQIIGKGSAPPPPSPIVTLTASPASVPSGSSSTLSWKSTNATTCVAAGVWAGSLALSGSESTGPLGVTSIYSIGCSGAPGTTPASATVTVVVTTTSGQVQRPAYNTGVGLFVLNGKLYDANGNEFRVRGVNRNHYDSNSGAGIAKSGANAVRVFVETNWGASVATLVGVMQSHITNKEIAIPTSPYTTSGTQTSCSSSTAVLSSVVANWVATASSWKPLERNMIVNLANEWGPSNSTVWRDSYISAVASMRAAGYLGTLLIDTGGCGQDINDLASYASAVFNSDPQKNIVFAFHFYGLGEGPPYSTVAQMNAIFAQLQSLSTSQGIAFAVTEFGPGRDIGPSPTMVTPGQVIASAESYGLGWAAWAWDDNDLGGGGSDDNSFSMTYAGPGIYNTPSDLTIYGKDVVLNPTYGLQALAVPATSFP